MRAAPGSVAQEAAHGDDGLHRGRRSQGGAGPLGHRAAGIPIAVTVAIGRAQAVIAAARTARLGSWRRVSQVQNAASAKESA